LFRQLRSNFQSLHACRTQSRKAGFAPIATVGPLDRNAAPDATFGAFWFWEASLEHYSDARQRSSPERNFGDLPRRDRLPRSREFYAGLFGYSVMQSDDRFCAFSVGGRQVLLLFVRGTDPQGTTLPFGTIPPHGTSGPAHVGFSIPSESLPALPGPRAVRASISATPMDIFLSSSLREFGRSTRRLLENPHMSRCCQFSEDRKEPSAGHSRSATDKLGDIARAENWRNPEGMSSLGISRRRSSVTAPSGDAPSSLHRYLPQIAHA
jgi:hypothetical protein